MSSSWLLIEHGTVIDGDANPPMPDTPVLIRDRLIHAVGASADRSAVPTGEELTVIDAAGRTVMPGLIDAHCHMTYGQARTEEEIDLYTSHELRTLIAAHHMKKVLQSGVTSISQPGGSYYIGVGLREAVRRGMIDGPRTTAAGRYLSTNSSLTDWYPDSVGVCYLNVRVDHEGSLVNSIAVDEKRAPLVRRAFELYATGKYPIERLEATMADLGLTTRPTKRYPEQPVSSSKLHDMLGDPYYVGFVIYKGDIYPGRHEPIIKPELFERVQEVMKARSGRGQRDRVHHHYLKGFLFCDRCHQQDRTSRLIFAEVTGRGGIKYQYFVCRGREDGLCNLPHLRVELVEQAIIDHYQTFSLPDDFVSELRGLLDETLADESAGVKERHAALQRQLKKLDQQEDRLVSVLADDTMPAAKIKAKLQEITIQRVRIQAGLTKTTAELSLGIEMLRDALRLVANPRQLYHDGTDSIRRLLNETFFERFYLDDPDVATDEKTPLFTELHDAHRAYRQRTTPRADGMWLASDRAGHRPGSGAKSSRQRKRPSSSGGENSTLDDRAVQENGNGPTLASVFSVTGSGKARSGRADRI